MQDEVIATQTPQRVAWNKGKLTGAQSPPRLGEHPLETLKLGVGQVGRHVDDGHLPAVRAKAALGADRSSKFAQAFQPALAIPPVGGSLLSLCSVGASERLHLHT